MLQGKSAYSRKHPTPQDARSTQLGEGDKDWTNKVSNSYLACRYIQLHLGSVLLISSYGVAAFPFG